MSLPSSVLRARSVGFLVLEDRRWVCGIDASGTIGRVGVVGVGGLVSDAVAVMSVGSRMAK